MNRKTIWTALLLITLVLVGAALFADVGKLEAAALHYPFGMLVPACALVLGNYTLTLKKTGKSVATDWVHVFTVRDGKVAAFTEFTDTAQFVDGYRG